MTETDRLHKNWDIIIIGGGAAGFFTALNAAENNPESSIAILEKTRHGLQKLKISGGGRCNVTHADFLPKSLSENYPRGQKELLGPFHSFMTGDTMQWFEDRGVALKIEEDGRVFPVSDSSQSIIDCFIREAKRLGVEIYYNCNVEAVVKDGDFKVSTNEGQLQSKQVIIATGSSPAAWNWISALGHHIVPAVPSLFRDCSFLGGPNGSGSGRRGLWNSPDLLFDWDQIVRPVHGNGNDHAHCHEHDHDDDHDLHS